MKLCRVLRETELSAKRLTEEIYKVFNDGNLKRALEKSSIKSGNNKILREIYNTVNR